MFGVALFVICCRCSVVRTKDNNDLTTFLFLFTFFSLKRFKANAIVYHFPYSPANICARNIM